MAGKARQTVKRGFRFALPPPAILALLYSLLIFGGTILLLLPFSTRTSVSVADAFFTATSAVTVTGLSVVDVGTHFTGFGQGVIALLIQLGGLGLMTFAVLVLTALGIPVGMPHRMILQEDLNQTSLHNILVLARIILTVGVLCEAAGAAALAFAFVPQFGWSQGIWYAVFHSISAFNNAGFSLFPDNLSGWVGDPIVNIVIPVLFITGGLGFIVITDIHQKRAWRTLTLHSKLMLVGTLALILFAWPTFALLEWDNPRTLGRLDGFWTRVEASWFQAVTPRTAGFNTLDLTGIHDPTSLMIMALMLVGGGSTSTAGGIKVTTLIVLLLATNAFFRRQPTIHAFGRSLGNEEIFKVMAITTISILLVLGAIFVASITYEGHFLNLVFEVTSAFGTVGLSRGATAELDGLGRTVIVAMMFLGRVGPLTVGFFLATRSVPRIRYPEGRVFLG